MIKVINIAGLPEGCVATGVLHDEPVPVYELASVVSIKLPNGRTIDVGWDNVDPGHLYRVALYSEFFGDRYADIRVKTIEEATAAVQRLART